MGSKTQNRQQHKEQPAARAKVEAGCACSRGGKVGSGGPRLGAILDFEDKSVTRGKYGANR
jgi:hypothetical protein